MKQKKMMKTVLAGYRADIDHKRPRRMAELLNYCADNAPKLFIPWPWVAKIACMESTLPREDSLAVEQVKGSRGGAKEILRVKYGRSIASRPGDGIRATVDADDQAATSHGDSQRRVVSAIKGLEKEDAILNINEIRDDALKARARKGRKITKVLTSPQIVGALRLAAVNAKKKNKR